MPTIEVWLGQAREYDIEAGDSSIGSNGSYMRGLAKDVERATDHKVSVC
jgi:hypothetical protein